MKCRPALLKNAMRSEAARNCGKSTTAVVGVTGTFDAQKKRVYCASGSSGLSVVEETADGAVTLGTVKTAPGAHTITVDPKTHAVWIAYADKEAAYIRRLMPP